jgi:hypothetical protein
MLDTWRVDMTQSLASLSVAAPNRMEHLLGLMSCPLQRS